MFIHRKNALKAHQHISYCSIQRNHFKKKFIKKFDQNVHQDASNCTFFQKISRGSMPSSMCAADIFISI